MDPQIQELIDRMRELVITMRETSKTGAVNNDKARSDTDPLAKSFTRNVDRLITSLGMLSVKLDGTSRTRAEEEHAAKRFTANVNRATKAQDQQNAAIEENIKAQRRAAMTADEIAAEQQKIAQDAASDAARAASTAAKTASDNAKTAQRAKEDATRDASYKAQGILSGNKLMAGLTALAGSSVAAQLAVSSFGGILSGARGVGTAMTGLGSSLASGNTAFTSLNGVVGALGSALGKIPLVGGGLEAVAQGTSFLITQIETNISTFKEFAQVGALTAKGMTGIQEQFLTSGQSMAGFKKNVIDFAPALARFKGDVGTGASEFAKITGSILDKNGEFADLGTQIRRIGIDADQFGESTADYVKMQSQLGLAQKKDYKQLALGSVEYAKEMDLLSRLTGQSRKALQGQIDAAMSETRFRSTIETMNANGQEEAATALTLFQSRVSSVNAELGQAVRDISSGVPDSEAYQKFVRAGFDPGPIVEAIKSGGLGLDKAMAQLQEGTKAIAPNLISFGGYVKDIDSIMPNLAKLLDFTRAQVTGTGELVVTAQKKLAGGADGLTNNVVAAQEALLQASRNITNFGFALMPTATTAIEAFAKTLDTAVEKIGKALGINLPKIGGGAAPPGPTAPSPTAPLGRSAAGIPISSDAASRTAAITESRTVADAARERAADAIKKHEEAKTELALLKKSNASRERTAAVEASVATLAKERETSEQAEITASRKVSTEAAALKAQQAADSRAYTKWLNGNVTESERIGEVIVSDEKSKQSYVFDEVKLFKADRDNYERYVKRKDELTNAELKSFKDRSGTDAAGDVKKAIETRGREQARREFAPAVQASGGARPIQYAPVASSTTLGSPNEPAPTKPTSTDFRTQSKYEDDLKSYQKRQGKTTGPAPSAQPPAPSAATSPRAPGSASAASLTGKSPLAELVARGESTGAGGYNAANYDGGKKAYKAGEKDLTGKTIGEIQSSQSTKEIFAAGRYQIVPETMQEAVQKLGLKSTDKFDEAMQDRIFNEYLTGVKRPEIQSFLSGDKAADVDAAVLSLAKEFASVGVPSSMTISDKHGERKLNPGDGYYSGVGGNPKGIASITPDQARAALTQTRDQLQASVAAPAKLALGGVVKSTPGGVGVIAGEAGRNEAFVPLPDGKSIPVVIQDVQNLSAQVSGLSKLIAGKMITQTGATDDELGMDIKSSDVLAKLIRTIIPGLGQIEKVAGIADPDSKMTGSDKVMEVVKLLVPQVRILAGIYDTISPFLKSDDNTATLAKRQMPVAPVDTSTTANDSDSTKATTALAASISDLGKITGNNPLAPPNATAAPDWAKMESKLSATMSDFGNLAGTNTPNLGEITAPSIDRADVTSNNIGKLIDELKEQNRSNMKDAMSSVTGELKDAFKGMSPQSQDNSASQELVAAVNEMVRTQRDTNAISSRILQVSQN